MQARISCALPGSKFRLNVNHHIDLPPIARIWRFCRRRPPALVSTAFPQSLPGIVGSQTVRACEPFLAGSAEGKIFPLLDLIALGPHSGQKIIIVTALWQHAVNGLPQLFLEAGAIFCRRHLFLLFGAGLWILDHRGAVRPAQFIIELPQKKRGLFECR